MTRAELRWVLIVAVMVMLATTIPVLIGCFSQGTDWRFTGFVISAEDGNAYVAKMMSGNGGNWLFRTPYTTFPQRGFLIFLPYILLGKLVPPPSTHNQLVALYHVFRVFAGMLVILATYSFLSLFIARVHYRRLGLVLVTLGGGLGWLLILLNRTTLLGSLPLEFYSPETFGFLSWYAYPHYALARALLLLGLVAYLKATIRLDEDSNIAMEGLKVGVLWFLTGIIQPLSGLVMGVVVGIYLFVLAAWQAWLGSRGKGTAWPRLWSMIKLAMWAGLLPAPFLLYNLVSSRVDPFLRNWLEQSTFTSPHPLHYLAAYGLLLPFAIFGAKHLWQREDWAAKLPVAWAAFFPILAYAPISIQRRLPEGFWVALVTLAAVALETAKKRSIRRLGAVLLLALPSTALLLVGGTLAALQPAEPVFRSSDQVAAFEFMAELDDRNAVVLSSYETGNALPAWAPVFVVVGLGPESIGFTELMPRVEGFYQVDTTKSERLRVLRELDVDYVFWGPSERALGSWDPTTADFLLPAYRSADYWIFAVRK